MIPGTHNDGGAGSSPARASRIALAISSERPWGQGVRVAVTVPVSAVQLSDDGREYLIVMVAPPDELVTTCPVNVSMLLLHCEGVVPVAETVPPDDTVPDVSLGPKFPLVMGNPVLSVKAPFAIVVVNVPFALVETLQSGQDALHVPV